MAIAYFESSALVKLLLLEEQSEIATAMWEDADNVASGEFAYVEVRAALAAARRRERLDPGELRDAKRKWEALWREAWPVTATPETLRHAGDLAERHALRGYDAIHLASALTLADDAPTVVSWDTKLRQGALEAGLTVAPSTI